MGINDYGNTIGKKYGNLTVLRILDETDDNWQVLCEVKCDCGAIKQKRIYYILKGMIKSCGCGIVFSKNGVTPTRIYGIWYKMVRRCINKKDKTYLNYGAKGISVCDEWKNDFFSFYDWSLKNGYEKHLSIDRFPDKNGNYEPTNCRWATTKQQANNKTDNKILTIDGISKTFSEWCDFYKTDYHLAHERVFKYGWDIKESFTTPLNAKQSHLKRKRNKLGQFK